MPPPLPRYVVVEGPIGVGKTTLCVRLARDFGARLLLEAPQENTFLQRRISRRAIPYEARMDADYLHRLIEAYSRFFYNYDASPLLIVNAADADFVDNDEDYRLLLEQVKNAPKGRHFFNPRPL